HIIMDGTSQIIFFQKITGFYNGAEFPPLNLQYKDYCEWQNQEEQRTPVNLQKEYWLKELQGNLPVLNLPIDFPRPPEQSFEGDKIFFSSDKEQLDRLKKFALEAQVTLYMLCLAFFYTLLYKITGQEDIILGTDTSGRKHTDLNDLIGMFVNTVVLRNYPTAHKTFAAFLQEIKERTLAAFDNQDYPFNELLEQVLSQRDMSRNPIFDVAYYNAASAGETGPGQVQAVQELQVAPGDDLRPLILKPYRGEDKTAKFDLTLHITEADDGLYFIIEYCTRLFRKEKIEALAALYREIVDIVLLDPGIKLEEIEISLSQLAIKNKEIQLDELEF
ncbi:MAG TPA: condensation domain-containing protein, partial [Candidatus Deferrimicrobium sp.]|nr:condensation domain-containing protein [Candidatus Deferrimicrobium sp.]